MSRFYCLFFSSFFLVGISILSWLYLTSVTMTAWLWTLASWVQYSRPQFNRGFMTRTFWYLLYLSHSVPFPACVMESWGVENFNSNLCAHHLSRMLVSLWFYRGPIFGKLFLKRHSPLRLGCTCHPELEPWYFERDRKRLRNLATCQGKPSNLRLDQIGMIGVLRVQCVLGWRIWIS